MTDRFITLGIPVVRENTSIVEALAALKEYRVSVVAVFLSGQRVNLYRNLSLVRALCARDHGVVSSVLPDHSFSVRRIFIRARALRKAKEIQHGPSVCFCLGRVHVLRADRWHSRSSRDKRLNDTAKCPNCGKKLTCYP